MDQSVLNILYVVLSTTGTKIPILIKISLKVAVNCLSNRVAPNVELPIFVKQGSLAILLNYVRPLLPVYVRIADYLSDLAQFATNGDSTASVRVFTRFDNPKLSAHCRVLCQVGVRTWRVISLFKFTKGTVRQSIFYMIGQRQIVKCTLLSALIVDLHIVVNRFLV
jgi:hypothetical protein